MIICGLVGATASGIITGNKIGRFKNVGVGAYSLAMLCLIAFVIVRENCVCVCGGGEGGCIKAKSLVHVCAL